MYKPFSSIRATTLYAERDGWFNPAQNITDGDNVYGRLSYSGFAKQTAHAQTADAQWELKYTNVFERKLQISDAAGTVVAELKLSLWGHDATLTIPGKYDITFSKPSVWSSRFICTDPQRGTVLEFTSKPFSKRSIIITLKDSAEQNKLLPLLVFVGLNLMVLRRKKAAMVASHG